VKGHALRILHGPRLFRAGASTFVRHPSLQDAHRADVPWPALSRPPISVRRPSQ
jgi:hypothetical protein